MLKASYAIPGLPPPGAEETPAVLRALARAHRHLAELKGRAGTIPNQGILIDTLALQEAKASSEIENIVTTQDELFQASAFPDNPSSPAAKEVALYRDALRHGFDEQVRLGGLLTNNIIVAMFQILKRNQPLWYAPDQNYAGKHSAFVPFFGVPASTITASSRIAQISGAPIIPVLAQRLPDDQGYRITLQAPLENFPGEDAVSDAARILRIVEGHVRQIPEQYLWVHRRFKTRPPGEKSVYK